MPMHSSVVLRSEKGSSVSNYRIQILTCDNKIAGPAVEVNSQVEQLKADGFGVNFLIDRQAASTSGRALGYWLPKHQK